MTARTESVAPPTSGRRVGRWLLWTLQVLLAALFLVGVGLPKLLGEPFQVQLFADIGFGQWLRFAVGLLEVAGAIGLLVPRLAGLAATGLLVVMAGATLTWVVLLSAPAMALGPVMIGVLVAVVVWARRAEVAALLLRRSTTAS